MQLVVGFLSTIDLIPIVRDMNWAGKSMHADNGHLKTILKSKSRDISYIGSVHLGSFYNDYQ